VAKSARECHFLSQDPDRQLHVRLSHFRATPFFLLHTSYRAVSLGLVAAFLPVWAWIIIMLILLLLNFIITAKIFSMPKLYSTMTSMTAILTPSMYPTMEATHISILAKFHILNTVAVSGVIVIAALISNWFTIDQLKWKQYTPLEVVSHGEKLSELSTTSVNITQQMSETMQTPLLLTYGVLPPVAVASICYVVIIIIIMGVIRPGFLELPPSQYSSRRASVAGRRSQTSSEEVEKLTPVEEEKLTEGLIINGLENSNEVKTLTPKCENVSQQI